MTKKKSKLLYMLIIVMLVMMITEIIIFFAVRSLPLSDAYAKTKPTPSPIASTSKPPAASIEKPSSPFGLKDKNLSSGRTNFLVAVNGTVSNNALIQYAKTLNYSSKTNIVFVKFTNHTTVTFNNLNRVGAFVRNYPYNLKLLKTLVHTASNSQESIQFMYDSNSNPIEIQEQEPFQF